MGMEDIFGPLTGTKVQNFGFRVVIKIKKVNIRQNLLHVTIINSTDKAAGERKKQVIVRLPTLLNYVEVVTIVQPSFPQQSVGTLGQDEAMKRHYKKDYYSIRFIMSISTPCMHAYIIVYPRVKVTD